MMIRTTCVAKGIAELLLKYKTDLDRLRALNAAMLEALKDMRQTHSAHMDCQNNRCDRCNDTYLKASRAIAKAEKEIK